MVFFFKQKTAYEMLRSLVGSEMCIRDRLPPGLAFVSLSDKAWERNKKAKLPRYYFDLAKERKNQATNQTAYTPAISLVEGLLESLRIMQEETLPSIFARHKRLAAATR